MTEFEYCPFYCEENIWHLCRDERLPGGPRAALWITNERRQVAIFEQRLAQPGQPVGWDYHVVLVTGRGLDAQVWDLDSRLEVPTSISDYLDLSFPPVSARFAPSFRLVPAAEYLRTFASDRRHMKDPDDGWLHDPPPWPAIGTGHVLPEYLDLTRPDPGEVLTLRQLRARYS